MLSRPHRLTSSGRVELVKRRGRLVENHFLAVRCLLRKKGEGPTRVAFVVGKKIDHRAVGRHRVKRQLRGAVVEIGERLKPGFDVVIIAKPKIAGIDYRQLLEILIENLQQAGLVIGGKQSSERLRVK